MSHLCPDRLPIRPLNGNTEDSDLGVLQESFHMEIYFHQSLLQALAEESIFSGMQEDMFGYEVLIKGRIDFFQEIGPARLQDSRDLPKSTLPIRNMM